MRDERAALTAVERHSNRGVFPVFDSLQLELAFPTRGELLRVVRRERGGVRALLRGCSVRPTRLQRRLRRVTLLHEQHAVLIRGDSQRLGGFVAAQKGFRGDDPRQLLRRVELVLKRLRVPLGVYPIVDGVAQRRGARRARGGRHLSRHSRDPPLEQLVVIPQIRWLARHDADETRGEAPQDILPAPRRRCAVRVGGGRGRLRGGRVGSLGGRRRRLGD